MYAAFFLISTIIFIMAAGMVWTMSTPLGVAFVVCAFLTISAAIFNALNGK